MSSRRPDLGVSRLGRRAVDVAANGTREAARLAESGAKLWRRQVRWSERLALRALHERLAAVASVEHAPQVAEVSAAETMGELLSIRASSGTSERTIVRNSSSRP